MGGFELILLSVLPLALLAGLVESKLQPDTGDGAPPDDAEPEAPRTEASGDLLDAVTLRGDPADATDGRGWGVSAASTAEVRLAPPVPAAATGDDAPTPEVTEADTRQGPDPHPDPDRLETGSPTDAPPTAPAALQTPASPAPPAAGSAPGTPDPADDPEFGRYAPHATLLGTAAGEHLTGTDGDDVILANGFATGTTAGNLVEGGAGDDTLLGGAGSDTLTATAGDNVIRASWDLNLEVSQGSDLFAWRDNGAPDILEGGAGNDRLIFARGDIATGGGGANVFEVWHDPASTQPCAVVTDFDPSADRLDVVMRIDEGDHPDCGTWAWDRSVQASVFEDARIEITADPATGRTEIRVDGEPVARLLGAPEVPADRVRVFAFWDITT